MEQIVILAFIGLVSLVNWLIKRSSDLREKRKLEQKRLGITEGNPFRSDPDREPPTPEPVPQDADPAAGMRKVMEALGLPLEDEPRAVRYLPPPKPESSLPPLPAFEKNRTPRHTAPPVHRVPVKPAAPALPAVPATVTSRPPNTWATLLRSRESARQAIVLREILGPPKAFSLPSP